MIVKMILPADNSGVVSCYPYVLSDARLTFRSGGGCDTLIMNVNDLIEALSRVPDKTATVYIEARPGLTFEEGVIQNSTRLQPIPTHFEADAVKVGGRYARYATDVSISL